MNKNKNKFIEHDSNDQSGENKRSVGISAHVDTGKTTLTEVILYKCGYITKIGSVDSGNTQTDFSADERARGITIFAACTTLFYKGYEINLIDTPGHIDFTGRVQSSLRIMNTTIVMIDGKRAIQPQTITVWNQASEHKTIKFLFVNKMDLEGANFDTALEDVKKTFGGSSGSSLIPLIINIPIGSGSNFEGIIDIIEKKAYFYNKNSKGSEAEERDLPKDEKLLKYIDQKRSELISIIVNEGFDNEDLEKFIKDEKYLTNEKIREFIRKIIINKNYKDERIFIPVFCGSAYKAMGIRAILDGIVYYAPSPYDINFFTAKDSKGNTKTLSIYDKEFKGLCFKVSFNREINVMKLSYIRVYSGQLKRGDLIYNVNKKKFQKINKILKIYINRASEIDYAEAGDVIAIPNIEFSVGNTLIDNNDEELYLDPIVFLEPMVSSALVLDNRDKKKFEQLKKILSIFHEEDPTFKFRYNEETDELIIYGMGELHLQVITSELREKSFVFIQKAPKVSYRETITKTVFNKETRFIQQTGGKGSYAIIKVSFEPNPGKGFIFENKTVGGVISEVYVKAVRLGFENQAKRGLLLGYPLIDFKVTLVDGKMHTVDSSDNSFRMVAEKSLRENSSDLEVIMLEPIVDVQVYNIPFGCKGSIIGFLTSRRGKIKESDFEDSDKINAKIPLSEIIGNSFQTELRSLTKGSSNYSQNFSHYQQVSIDNVEKYLGISSKNKKNK